MGEALRIFAQAAYAVASNMTPRKRLLSAAKQNQNSPCNFRALGAQLAHHQVNRLVASFTMKHASLWSSTVQGGGGASF
jgi:hypothetical protein